MNSGVTEARTSGADSSRSPRRRPVFFPIHGFMELCAFRFLNQDCGSFTRGSVLHDGGDGGDGGDDTKHSHRRPPFLRSLLAKWSPLLSFFPLIFPRAPTTPALGRFQLEVGSEGSRKRPRSFPSP